MQSLRYSRAYSRISVQAAPVISRRILSHLCVLLYLLTCTLVAAQSSGTTNTSHGTPTHRHIVPTTAVPKRLWNQTANETVATADKAGWKGTLSVLQLDLFFFVLALAILMMSRSGRKQLFCFGTGSAGVPGKNLWDKMKRFFKLRVDSAEVQQRCGTEGSFFLLFEKYTLLFLIALTIYGLAVLLPVYVTAPRALASFHHGPPHSHQNLTHGNYSIGHDAPINSSDTYSPSLSTATDAGFSSGQFYTSSDFVGDSSMGLSSKSPEAVLDFSITTIRDLPAQSPALWAPAFSVFLTTILFFLYIRKLDSCLVLQARRATTFYSSRKGKMRASLKELSLFIRDGINKDCTEKRAEDLIAKICPEAVHRCCFVPNLSTLRQLNDRRINREKDMERLLILRERVNDGSVPVASLLCPGHAWYPNLTFCCKWEGFVEREQKLRREISATAVSETNCRNAAQKLGGLGTGKGFLIFSSSYYREKFITAYKEKNWLYLVPRNVNRQAAERAIEELHLSRWVFEPCPELDDIQWWAMSFSSAITRKFTTFVINVFLIVTLILFTSPVAVTSAMSSATALQGVEASLSNIIDRVISIAASISPMMSHLLFAYLPSLILMVINWALIEILWIAARSEAILTASDRERKVMRVTAIYLVFNTLIVPSLAFASLSAFLSYINHSNQDAVLNIIASIFVNSSGLFFMNYVIQRALLGTAVELMRGGEVAFFCWLSSRAITPKEQSEAVEAWEFFIGLQYGMLLSVIAVIVVFSTVVPLILPVGILYILVKHNVDKYHLNYVRPRVSGSGRIGRSAMHSVLAILLLYQICMAAYFFIRGTTLQSTLIGLWVFFTHCAGIWWYMGDRSRFRSLLTRSVSLSLSGEAEQESKEREEEEQWLMATKSTPTEEKETLGSIDSNNIIEKYFYDPVLFIDDEALIDRFGRVSSIAAREDLG